MSYEVVIRGFNTQAEAEAFSSWYEGQGEQDIVTWLEYRKEEGLIKIDSLNSKHPYDTWENNQLILHVEPQ